MRVPSTRSSCGRDFAIPMKSDATVWCNCPAFVPSYLWIWCHRNLPEIKPWIMKRSVRADATRNNSIWSEQLFHSIQPNAWYLYIFFHNQNDIHHQHLWLPRKRTVEYEWSARLDLLEGFALTANDVSFMTSLQFLPTLEALQIFRCIVQLCSIPMWSAFSARSCLWREQLSFMIYA